MTDKEIIIDGVDVSGCGALDEDKYHKGMYSCEGENCDFKFSLLQEHLQTLKTENKELKEQLAQVIYRATGGMLSYSNYTLNAIEDAFNNMVNIKVDQKIKEINSELARHKQVLEKVETLIKAAVNPKQTPEADSSLDALYEALEIIKEIKD